MQIMVLGFGGIGFRHYEALLKVIKKEDRIVIIDPSEEAYELFKSVASQDDRIEFFSSLCNSTAGHFDLLVSATSALHRCKSLVKFNEMCTAKHVLLEKVVFSTCEEFDLLEATMGAQVETFFINHPYRYYPFYEKIKKLANFSDHFQMDVNVGNWGLLSNSLHKIDLCEYLFSTRVIEVDCSGLSPLLFESKRAGYFEASGKIKVTYANGGCLTISHQKSNRDWEMDIAFGGYSIALNLTTKKLVLREPRGQVGLDDICVPFQSELTGSYLQDMISGTCRLTTFPESRRQHEVLLKSLERHFDRPMDIT